MVIVVGVLGGGRRRSGCSGWVEVLGSGDSVSFFIFFLCVVVVVMIALEMRRCMVMMIVVVVGVGGDIASVPVVMWYCRRLVYDIFCTVRVCGGGGGGSGKEGRFRESHFLHHNVDASVISFMTYSLSRLLALPSPLHPCHRHISRIHSRISLFLFFLVLLILYFACRLIRAVRLPERGNKGM